MASTIAKAAEAAGVKPLIEKVNTEDHFGHILSCIKRGLSLKSTKDFDNAKRLASTLDDESKETMEKLLRDREGLEVFLDDQETRLNIGKHIFIDKVQYLAVLQY